MIHRSGLAAALAVPLALVACGGESLSDIAVEDTYARETIGAATTGAAYLTVHNSGAADDALIAAATPVAETAELHTHEMDGGVMRMRRMDLVDIPAGETVTFEPGGLHVMLFGLSAPLRAGGTFPITLTFDGAGDITVEASVVSIADTLQGTGTGAMDHQGMDHSGH